MISNFTIVSTAMVPETIARVLPIKLRYDCVLLLLACMTLLASAVLYKD